MADITGKIDAALNGIFQQERIAANLCRGDASSPEVLSQGERFVPADVFFVEELPVEIAGLDNIAVQQRSGQIRTADPLRPRQFPASG